MLVGLEIDLGMSLWIALIGMGVVMLELLLLLLFVQVLARITKMFAQNKLADQVTNQAAQEHTPQNIPAGIATNFADAGAIPTSQIIQPMQTVPIMGGTASQTTEMAVALSAAFAEIGVIPNGDETIKISADSR